MLVLPCAPSLSVPYCLLILDIHTTWEIDSSPCEIKPVGSFSLISLQCWCTPCCLFSDWVCYLVDCWLKCTIYMICNTLSFILEWIQHCRLYRFKNATKMTKATSFSLWKPRCPLSLRETLSSALSIKRSSAQSCIRLPFGGAVWLETSSGTDSLLHSLTGGIQTSQIPRNLCQVKSSQVSFIVGFSTYTRHTEKLKVCITLPLWRRVVWLVALLHC